MVQLASAGLAFMLLPSAARLLVSILIAIVSGQVGAIINRDLRVSLVGSTSGVPFTAVIFTMKGKEPDCAVADIYSIVAEAGKVIIVSASGASDPAQV